MRTKGTQSETWLSNWINGTVKKINRNDFNLNKKYFIKFKKKKTEQFK